MKMTQRFGLAVVSLLLICGVAVAGSFVLRQSGDIPAELRGIVLSNPIVLEQQSFATAKGEIVFPPPATGRWTFLAVGYAQCPDVCPFLLGNLAALEGQMRESYALATLPRFAFLSVDPARDTPEFLGEYVANFSDRFVGMTGEKSAIDNLTRDLGAFYRLGTADADGFYPVDHSAEIFVIDPQGRLFGKLKPPLDPLDVTSRFELLRKLLEQEKS